MLLAIDPGIKTGVACFVGGKLIWAIVTDGDCETMSFTFSKMNPPPRQVVCELPQIYSSSKSKGDPNSLIPLAVQCGNIEAFALRWGSPCKMVLPRAWKGQVPKAIHRERLKKVLSPAEMKAATQFRYSTSVDHNKWDAIGIRLWWLKRK